MFGALLFGKRRRRHPAKTRWHGVELHEVKSWGQQTERALDQASSQKTPRVARLSALP